MKKKIINLYKKTIGKINNKKIKNKNITIISNNCWGGIFYRNNNLEYCSPTLGMFFMADEYIKFIYEMKKYIESEIQFISVDQSRYCQYLKMIKYDGLVAQILDLEICFLHYDSEEEAKEKWNRRKERINWDNILFKFNDQNLCTYENLKRFNEFEAKNKICFTSKKYSELKTVQIKKYEKYNYVLDDIKSYKTYIDIIQFINNMK
ncbi:Uncharacterized protein, DUF1919 family [Terrisporobacter glycolicus]|nr:Uncharacterized protein, DUF1919 family [Terrisporobacter glycolicus]